MTDVFTYQNDKTEGHTEIIHPLSKKVAAMLTNRWLYGLVVLFWAFQVNAAARYSSSYEVSKNGVAVKGVEIAIVDGDKARIEVRGADGERTPDAPYFLTVDGGETWVTAGIDGDPVCSTINTNEFFHDIGAFINRLDRLVGAGLGKPSVKKVLEEPGTEMLGYPTTHIRLVSSAAVKTWIFFRKFEYRLELTDDVWYAPKLEIHPIQRKWLHSMVQTGHKNLDELFKMQIDQIGGTILKQKSLIRLIDVVKRKEEIRTENIQMMAIENITPEQIPADVFLVPECKMISTKKMKKTAKYIFIPG